MMSKKIHRKQKQKNSLLSNYISLYTCRVHVNIYVLVCACVILLDDDHMLKLITFALLNSLFL